MKTQAQVVVVGGGVVGASVLYHLTKAGWTDVVLLERHELTAGSTWHSAGGMHTLNGDPNVAKLQQYTIELYKEIEEISGQDCGIHITGGVMLADTPERLDWLKMSHARGRYLGMDTELISIAEAKELMPIFEEKYFVGAMYDANEGHVDPSGVTNAYAKAARMAGAEVYRNTWVRDINRATDGGWDLELLNPHTNEELGNFHCEHVVNAGGLWAREVGRMVGLETPLLAMEHMYLLTEDLPEVAEINSRSGQQVLHAIDFGGEIYMRQEGNGLLLGTYEKNGRPWSSEQTPWDFGTQLLQPDLEHIADSLEVGFKHFPIFAEAGIKKVINGPFTFAPDGNPLLGPVRGLPNYWSACAVMAGLSQGGGVGLTVANWITEGDPGADVWGMDISRFGDYSTMQYTDTKVRENYGRRFRITFPNEFLAGGRPLMTSPIYDRMVGENAVFGNSFGLENPLWFQTPGEEPVERVTFGRSNAWDNVKKESLAIRNSVGMMETTGFAKFEFFGPGSREYLNKILAGRIPKPGRMALTPMLNRGGTLIGDLTVACLGPAIGQAEGPYNTITGGATSNIDGAERFLVFGSGVAQSYYERWFDQHLPADGSVRYVTHGYEMTGLSIAGPNSRALLEKLTNADVSPVVFRFMDFRRMDVGMVPLYCGRVTFTGDLGYEFWMPASYQRHVFDLIRDAGKEFDMTLFGSHALNSLRLEKSFGSWAREYRPLYDPVEAQFGRFIRKDGGFIGAEALAKREHKLELCTWVVDATEHDVIGDEPIWHNGEVVGWVTSGGYAHAQEKSVAMGYVPVSISGESVGFEIEIVRDRREATRLDQCLYDPSGALMRS